MLLNVLDFPTVQQALDVASTGDRIYFPGGRPYAAPPDGWHIRKSLEIFGDGPGTPTSYSGTVLTPSVPTQGYPQHVLVFEAGMSGAPPQLFVGPVHIHDLRITRRPGQSGLDGGDGIRFVSGQDYRLLTECSIERVGISYLGGAGIRLEGFNGGNAAVAGLHIADIDVTGCGDVGLSLVNATLGHIARARISGNAKEGLVASLSELAVYSSIFDGNRTQSGRAEAVLTLCKVATVESCRFKNFGIAHAGEPPKGVILDRCGGAAVLRSSVFELSTNVADSIGAEFLGVFPAPGGPALILANRFVRVATGVQIEPGFRYVTVHPQFCNDVAAPVVLPTGLTDIPIGCPTMRGPQSSQISGYMLPRMSTSPTSNVEPGTLAYVNGEFQAFVGNPPSWRRVKVGPS